MTTKNELKKYEVRFRTPLSDWCFSAIGSLEDCQAEFESQLFWDRAEGMTDVLTQIIAVREGDDDEGDDVEVITEHKGADY